jgi:hypothetical protein
MNVALPYCPFFVTLAKNEHSEVRSVSGTIPGAQRRGIRDSLKKNI